MKDYVIKHFVNDSWRGSIDLLELVSHLVLWKPKLESQIKLSNILPLPEVHESEKLHVLDFINRLSGSDLWSWKITRWKSELWFFLGLSSFFCKINQSYKNQREKSEKTRDQIVKAKKSEIEATKSKGRRRGTTHSSILLAIQKETLMLYTNKNNALQTSEKSAGIKKIRI